MGVTISITDTETGYVEVYHFDQGRYSLGDSGNDDVYLQLPNNFPKRIFLDVLQGQCILRIQNHKRIVNDEENLELGAYSFYFSFGESENNPAVGLDKAVTLEDDSLSAEQMRSRHPYNAGQKLYVPEDLEHKSRHRHHDQIIIQPSEDMSVMGNQDAGNAPIDPNMPGQAYVQPTQRSSHGRQPYDQPTQRRPGRQPYDQPTQRRPHGRQPYDQPTQRHSQKNSYSEPELQHLPAKYVQPKHRRSQQHSYNEPEPQHLPAKYVQQAPQAYYDPQYQQAQMVPYAEHPPTTYDRTPKPKPIMLSLFLAMLALIGLAALGYGAYLHNESSQDLKLWNKTKIICRKDNVPIAEKISAIQTYLLAKPDGRYVLQAEQLLDKLTKNKQQGSQFNQLNAYVYQLCQRRDYKTARQKYEEFLIRNPETRFHGEINRKIAELFKQEQAELYKKLKARVRNHVKVKAHVTAIKLLEDYLVEYPTTPYKDKITDERDRLRRLVQQQLYYELKNNISLMPPEKAMAALNAYMEEHGHEAYNYKEAKTLLEELKAEYIEPRVLNILKSSQRQLAELPELCDASKETFTMITRVQNLVNAEKYMQARRVIEIACRDLPKKSQTWKTMAMLLKYLYLSEIKSCKQKGNWHHANLLCTKALKIFPDSKRLMRFHLEIERENIPDIARKYYTKAKAYEKEKKYGPTIQYYQKAYPMLNKHYRELVSKDMQTAKELLWEKALEMANHYETQGETEKALEKILVVATVTTLSPALESLKNRLMPRYLNVKTDELDALLKQGKYMRCQKMAYKVAKKFRLKDKNKENFLKYYRLSRCLLMYQEARQAFDKQEYAKARKLCQNALEEYNYREASEFLEKLRQMGWFGEKMPKSLQRSSIYGEYIWTKNNSIMVYVPAGMFLRGSTAKRCGADEKPIREIELDAYYIDKYAVTWSQYERFCEARGQKLPQKPKWAASDHPVVNLTWYEAVAYCEWSGKSLPTEAQWEKAARGGLMIPDFSKKETPKMVKNPLPKRLYPWNNDPPNAGGRYRCNFRGKEDNYQYSCPVTAFATYNKSPYGCIGMSGNVWEWCRDFYRRRYYHKSPRKNPLNTNSYYNKKVLRGGAWNDAIIQQRICYRKALIPSQNGYFYGLRSVLTVSQK